MDTLSKLERKSSLRLFGVKCIPPQKKSVSYTLKLHYINDSYFSTWTGHKYAQAVYLIKNHLKCEPSSTEII